ncbi:DUF4149 domain-containing protein [Sulfurimonas lithotrophica]|uniref:DUF4149 domain-containing protein n=1 Tax=Sulfurimonas lithotrophica TaxID=2590022 RepID=A0A5P8P1A9_9BACT|nr:DUF4149 domain-containing protein [Sulfurimonas lithotrophica]QFR49513.1 DUF4149 domain-containing protein [Sulfurimonas lithotrophica]
MRRNIYLDFSYLLVLSATLGGVLVLGTLVAPVVFHNSSLGMEVFVDKHNAGIMMAEIFHRFSYWLYFVSFYVLAYELYMYKIGQRDTYVFVGATLVSFSALMFSAVYAPKILSMQSLGREATQSDTFLSVHMASEIDFKILAVGLLLLFIRRLMLMRTR